MLLVSADNNCFDFFGAVCIEKSTDICDDLLAEVSIFEDR